jgi:hypothetical protein
VYAVSPTGSIVQGSTIDVTYYVGNFAEIPVEIPDPDPTESATVSPDVSESPTVSDEVTVEPDPDAAAEEPAPSD